jgi:hypothetical protein
LVLRRGGEINRQEIRSASVETPHGQLIRFESQMSLGPSPIRTLGRVRGDKLDIEIGSPGPAAPAKVSIRWSSDYGGPFATDETLLRQPMRPGQRRRLKALVIGFNQVADVEMIAKDFERTVLPDGARELLRIDTVTQLAGGQKIEGTIWSDRQGETLKTYSAAMGGLETCRATKAEALQKIDAELDLLPSMMVHVEQPLPHPHQTQQVRYRVRLEGGDPAKIFLTGPSQAVKSIDAHTAEVTVYAIRPGRSDGNTRAAADPPTEDDRRPTSFIESDDALVVADARRAAGEEKDPWRLAVALERFVNREVQDKDFTQGLATAAEVARSREGDCTEHAVLLAALCRACGIPARVAIGLVYLEGRQAFFYHMWTEVYIERRWIAIDATLAQGGIGAAHLKIAQSSLAGASAYDAFLPVAQVAGRLRIEILAAQ